MNSEGSETSQLPLNQPLRNVVVSVSSFTQMIMRMIVEPVEIGSALLGLLVLVIIVLLLSQGQTGVGRAAVRID